jgi:methylenetetrahydrofolate dehydrogenase (NADP+) / methenyltetrahydrofolate cyclohydrolase
MYISLKEKAAKKIGIDFHKYTLSTDATQDEVLDCIGFLRDDEDVDAIIIQLPLPDHIDRDIIIDAMGPKKDADGFHPDNIEKYILGENVLAPVFPSALMEVAQAAGKDLHDLQAVIIGRSDIFTKAMVACATRAGMVIHRVACSDVKKMHKVIATSDVIFSACGTADLLSLKNLKKDAIVIDGGITHDIDGKIIGDVDVKSLKNFKGWISPVPGGVGPVTVACLLENVTLLTVKKK